MKEIKETLDDKPKKPIRSADKVLPTPDDEEVLFVSREPESATWKINGIKGKWNVTRERVCWTVPRGMVESFSAHPHVRARRVIRADV